MARKIFLELAAAHIPRRHEVAFGEAAQIELGVALDDPLIEQIVEQAPAEERIAPRFLHAFLVDQCNIERATAEIDYNDASERLVVLDLAVR